MDEDDNDDYEENNESTCVEGLIATQEDAAWKKQSYVDEENFLNLSCAAVALAMDNTLTA